jgi:hypothetical protein
MSYVLLGGSFLLSVIALFMNIGLPKHKNAVDVSMMQYVPIVPFYDNVTTPDVAPLVACREYVQTHVPNATGYNWTSNVVVTALNNLATSLYYTGVSLVSSAGIVRVNGGNFTLGYEKRVLFLGNGSFYYVHVPSNQSLYTVAVNGTFTLSLDGWTPAIYPGGGAYNATEPVFDDQRTKLQSAPFPMAVQTKSYSYTAIRLTDPVTVLVQGNVVQVTRSLQL